MPDLLRPDFTRELAARLLAGESINLTATHGLGRRRTLTDLRAIFPQQFRVLHADMKFCAADFSHMLHDLCEQAGLSNTDIQHAGDLIAGLAASPEGCLLVLHNIDLLRSAPHDRRFDSDLLPHLSGFAQHSHLALLTVSEALYTDWPLPCNALELPPLTAADAHP